MKSFRLYIYKSDAYRILLTAQNNKNPNEHSSLYSSFDEKLTIEEHDQASLTFSLYKYVEGFSYNTQPTHRTENKFHQLLQMGTKIELILDNADKYLFVITKIKPTFTKNNVRFDYTCQDEVSYYWSRRNLGMSYSTLDYNTTQTIYEIALNVLEKAYISDWVVKARANNEIEEDLLTSRRITFEIEDSNPYNILIEVCNTLNAYMIVNYTHRYISFYQKDKVAFSGYRYRPETNLKQLNADYSLEETATIMHVYGGTDEFGRIISLFPPLPDSLYQKVKDIDNKYNWNTILNDVLESNTITDTDKTACINFCTVALACPALGNFLYNFDFFKNNRLLSEDSYSAIMNILEVDMAKNNLKLKYYEPLYWRNYSNIYMCINQCKIALEAGENTGAIYDELTQLIKGTYSKSVFTLGTNKTDEKWLIDVLQAPYDESKFYETEASSAKSNMIQIYETVMGRTISDNDINELLTWDWERYITRWDEVDDVKAKIKSDWTYYLTRYTNYTSIVKQIYQPLIGQLKVIGRNLPEHALYNIVAELWNINTNLWANLYRMYGNYILENSYTNSDEMDSIGLFNQAQIYYADYNKPSANYSTEILDLSLLQPIGVPRLKIGSKIRVYNNEINLNDPIFEKSTGGEYIETPTLNTLQYTNNELIVTSLQYDLRKSASVQIGVQKVTAYKTILQKLIKTVK